MTDLGVAARLRAAFEFSPTILSVSRLADGRLVDVNDAFLHLTGYTREEVIGRPISELSLWVDPAQRERGLTALRAGGSIRHLEARLRTKAGGEIVTLASADVIDLDGERCVVTALTDITERVRAEAALRDSERRFSQAFHANPLPMSIVSLLDGRHLDVNEAAVRHSGYTRDEMVGRTKPELGFWVTAGERDRLLETLRQDGRARDFEVTFKTRGGERRQLLVNSEIISYGGEPAVLSVSLDITDRKQVEQAKDEFLAMLGHELRNPLGTIASALGVLARVLPAEQRPMLEIIDRQTDQLTRLVDDLMDVARLTAGKLELRRHTVDLRDLAQRCVDAAAGRTAGHRVRVDGPSLSVVGDPVRLEQIVRNLLDNALKYTPAGGDVRVGLRAVDGLAVLSVRDTGEGIAAELLPRIFDLFVQQPQPLARSRGGLGLGLALVKRLVELHGGSVAAHSEGPGQGSEFTVRLPLATAAPSADDAPKPAARSGGRRRRVLVVEDNRDARESLRLLLELAGHDVETSEDGPDGLDKLRVFRPEVALIDVGLPGLDGYAMARMVRKTGDPSAVRLIALTGYGQPEDRRRALDAGFDVHVTKPIDPDRLEELLG
jgi:PAS domain S-box-containing protein